MAELEWKSETSELFDAGRRESIAFLRGERDTTKWHHGPMEEETKPIAAALVKINELGLLTIASQPGLYGRHGPDCKEYTKESLAKWAQQHGAHVTAAVEKKRYVEIRQRAYIEGICLMEDRKEILAALKDKQLWIHYGGVAQGRENTLVDLRTTTVITVDGVRSTEGEFAQRANSDGWEAIVVDTRSNANDSKYVGEEFPKKTHYYLERLVIMDPLFRRNTLFDVLAVELARLRKEGKLSTTLL